MQAPAKRSVIPVLEMVGLGMGVSRGADILEITLRQGRLIFRKRGGVSARRRRRLARAQEERANGSAKKKEKAPVTQLRWLLTVIHNHMQEYFSGLAAGLTTT
jgi:hypothetical protein